MEQRWATVPSVALALDWRIEQAWILTLQEYPPDTFKACIVAGDRSPLYRWKKKLNDCARDYVREWVRVYYEHVAVYYGRRGWMPPFRWTFRAYGRGTYREIARGNRYRALKEDFCVTFLDSIGYYEGRKHGHTGNPFPTEDLGLRLDPFSTAVIGGLGWAYSELRGIDNRRRPRDERWFRKENPFNVKSFNLTTIREFKRVNWWMDVLQPRGKFSQEEWERQAIAPSDESEKSSDSHHSCTE